MPPPGRARGPAQPPGDSTPTRWVRLIAGFVAPTTALTALLFYFGFVATDSFYEYFGVDAASLGFSTQDYLLRSVGALYVPAGAILAGGILAIWAHAGLSRLLAARQYRSRIHRGALAVVAGGSVAFLIGVVGVFGPFGIEFGPLTTPICLGLGAVAVGYGRFLFLRSRAGRRPRGPDLAERAGLAGLVALATLALFWSANTYAIEYGHGQARRLAGHLSLRPAVTVDTRERLFYQFRDTVETALPVSSPGQQFRYRYRGLRLLAQSGPRMFLLPDSWTPRVGEVLVLDYGPEVRVQFHAG